MATTPPTVETIATYLTDMPGPFLTPLPETITWDAYAQLLTELEQITNQIFVEAEAAESAGEYAISLGNTGLTAISASLTNIESTLQAGRVQADRLSAQSLPITGGQYTSLVSETFQNTSVQDVFTDFSRQPLFFSPPVTGFAGCPAHPMMQINASKQVLQLAQEGQASVFEGVPQGMSTLGGTVCVEKIFGTPVAPTSQSPSAAWQLSVASRSPLVQGFSLTDGSVPDWLPNTYSAGGAVRLRLDLQNPSPVTELALRGAILPSSANTQLLETVARVDSRPVPSNPASIPVRAVSTNGNFATDSGWSDLIESYAATTILAGGAGVANQAIVTGLYSQKLTALRPGDHYSLSYQAACPFQDGESSPVPPNSTLVSLYYYASSGDTLGITVPLGVETFRDEYPHQGGLYAGWAECVHLLTIPSGTTCAYLVVGVDPYVNSGLVPQALGAAIAYANIWVSDDCLTSLWNEPIPAPPETNLATPGIPGGVPSYVDTGTIDALNVSLGNTLGTFVISQVWLTLGQSAASIDGNTAWKLLTQTDWNVNEELPPYSLVLPADTASGRAARDPILLHQARYIGLGVKERDASTIRLGGNAAQTAPSHKPRSLYSVTDQVSSPVTQGYQRSPLPTSMDATTGQFWSTVPGLRRRRPSLAEAVGSAQTRWSSLWSTLLGLAKMDLQPVGLLQQLFADNVAPSSPSSNTAKNSSLYVYTVALSSITLLRQEYAPSGLYVTNPLQSLDNTGSLSIPGEIREVVLLTQPSLSELGPRLRTWVIPDVLETTYTSGQLLLGEAVPLDSINPRVTFHSSVETKPGVQPATSDVATAFGVSNPAFYLTPTFYAQEILGGIDPDSVVNGVQLDRPVYINREAIHNIVHTIAGYDEPNPNVYDPNALRPVVDYLQTFDSGFVSSVNATFAVNNRPHVAPGTPNTVLLPFLNGSGGTVYPVQPYTLTYTLISSPSGSFFDTTTISTIVNTDATLSATFTAPSTLGDYQVDATLVIPSVDPRFVQNYTVHLRFNVAQPQVTSSTLDYVTGYRPVAVKIQLPSGQLILPDSVGKPRPGEIIFEPLEVLQPSIVTQTQTTPSQVTTYSNTATAPPVTKRRSRLPYTPTRSDAAAPQATTAASTSTSEVQVSSASQVNQIQIRSASVANTPIAAGATGVAISLWWHQSAEFNPSSGGVLTRFDVPIPASDFTVDAQTGQIMVTAQPPYGWAAYDSFTAQYFWVVGNIAPREWFPPPSITELQVIDELLDPQNFQSSTTGLSPTASQIITGYTIQPTGQLMTDPYLDTHAQFTPAVLPNVWVYDTNISDDNVNAFQSNDATPNNPFGGTPIVLNNPFGFHQDIPYPGPGQYEPVIGVSLWTAHSSDRQQVDIIRSVEVTLSVWDSTSGPFAPLETSTTLLITPIGWTTDPTISQSIYTPNYPQGYPQAGQLQTYYLSTDLLAAASGTSFMELMSSGSSLMLRLDITTGPGCGDGVGVQVGYVSLMGLTMQDTLGYPPGYDANGNLIPTPVFTSVTTDVTAGTAAATVSAAPTSVADLLKGPIQQSYPVTRNVTNYAGDTTAELTPPNFDYASPDYYPVIEYRIDPGNLFRFAYDFSTVGPNAGANILIEQEFLDINPRLVLEVVSPGLTQFSNPFTDSAPDDLTPQVTTPEITSLQLLVNARY